MVKRSKLRDDVFMLPAWPLARWGTAVLLTLFFFIPFLMREGFGWTEEPTLRYTGMLQHSSEKNLMNGGIRIQAPLIITGDEPITMNLRNAGIRDVLNMMARQGGFNVMVDESVAGQLTVDIQNISINQALAYIFTMVNLNYTRDGNTLIITSQRASQDKPFNRQIFKTIPVMYRSAPAVAEQLNAALFSVPRQGGSHLAITGYDVSSNSLLVVGNESDLLLIQQVLQELDIPPNRQIFPIRYHNPIHIAKLVAASFSPVAVPSSTTTSAEKNKPSEQVHAKDANGDGDEVRITAGGMVFLPDTGTSTLTVLGTPEQMALVGTIIREYDTIRHQVAVDISLVELDSEDSIQVFSDALSKTPRYGLVTPEAFNVIHWQPPNSRGKKSKSRILARPNIVTLDNASATVYLTEEVATVTQTVKGSLTQAEVTKETAGITVEVHPKVLPDGSILLTLKPTVAQPAGPFVVKDVDGNPSASFFLIQRRSVDIQAVRLNPGQTLVIGGLLQDQMETFKQAYHRQVSKSSVAKLPIVGAMFRTMTRGKGQKSRSELVLMVSARILNESSDAQYDPSKSERHPHLSKPGLPIDLPKVSDNAEHPVETR